MSGAVRAGAGGEDRRSRARSTVFGLQHRTEAVTETTLDQLGASGELSPAEYDIVIDVRGGC